MSISTERIAAIRAKIESDRAAGVVANNKGTFGAKLLSFQDNLIRGLNEFSANSEALAVARKEDKVRIMGVFLR